MTPEKNPIAPCGMDCALCSDFQRRRDRCEGCNASAASITPARLRCVIRNCPTIQANASGFCYECDRFPCARMRRLDARYRAKYGMSMVANQNFIKTNGLDAFRRREEERWACAACGDPVCVHKGRCLACGMPYGRDTKPL